NNRRCSGVEGTTSTSQGAPLKSSLERSPATNRYPGKSAARVRRTRRWLFVIRSIVGKKCGVWWPESHSANFFSERGLGRRQVHGESSTAEGASSAKRFCG